jgi:hypothetical protein
LMPSFSYPLGELCGTFGAEEQVGDVFGTNDI